MLAPSNPGKQPGKAARTHPGRERLENGHGLWHIRDVNANELKQLLKASPFRPITICTGSNKRYSIGHPEFAALSPAGDTLIVFLPGAGGHDVVDVPQIERVEVRKRSGAGLKG